MIKHRTKIRVRYLNLTLVTFWILLTVKCPLENYSKPYDRATAMPPAWGSNSQILFMARLRQRQRFGMWQECLVIKPEHCVDIQLTRVNALYILYNLPIRT